MVVKNFHSHRTNLSFTGILMHLKIQHICCLHKTNCHAYFRFIKDRTFIVPKTKKEKAPSTTGPLKIHNFYTKNKEKLT